jgi:hypothetical protein
LQSVGRGRWVNKERWEYKESWTAEKKGEQEMDFMNKGGERESSKLDFWREVGGVVKIQKRAGVFLRIGEERGRRRELEVRFAGEHSRVPAGPAKD